MIKARKVDIAREELPRYESDDESTIATRKKLYQQKYHKQYKEVIKEIKIRVEPEVYIKLKRWAKAENKPLSRYVMGNCLASIEKQTYRSKELKDILVQIVKMGTNLNQIARAINTSKVKMFGWFSIRKIENFREELVRLKARLVSAKD